MTRQAQLPIPAGHPDGTGTMPQWVTDQLNDDTLSMPHRNAIFTRCPRCQDITITGLDANILAQHATADPTPLDATQELACALTNRPTYTAQLRGTTLTIWYREIHIEKPPNTPGTWPVIPAHRCGQRFPGFLIPAQPERTKDAPPPF